MTSRTTSALGILAAALLFLSMFAGLFGGALSQGGTAPERQCTNCFLAVALLLAPALLGAN